MRYFTPAEEIPLAGHPTIATTFALVDTGRLALQGAATTLTLELQVGPIEVEIISENAEIQQIVMSQKKPQFLSNPRSSQSDAHLWLVSQRSAGRISDSDSQHGNAAIDGTGARFRSAAPSADDIAGL